jgi:hypothetical protein
MDSVNHRTLDQFSTRTFRYTHLKSLQPLLLVLLALAAAAAFFDASRVGSLRATSSGGAAECAVRARAAIVIVSYMPTDLRGEAARVVFERNIANIARFWPSRGEAEVFVADNNAADPESGNLLNAAVRHALGVKNKVEANARLRVHIIPNNDAAGGWRYVWGGIRAIMRAEGWLRCVPFSHVVVLHHTMALLRPLEFPAAGAEFRAFLDFYPIHFDTAFGPQRDWVLESAAAAGVNASVGLECDGVFGPAWVMSRGCLKRWLQRGVFERQVSTKGIGMGCERLAGILGATLCGSCRGNSVDGDMMLYPQPFRTNYVASDEELGDRTLLKMWGKGD